MQTFIKIKIIEIKLDEFSYNIIHKQFYKSLNV